MPAGDVHLIDDALVAFVRGPVSMFLATTDATGTPDATRVVGIAPIDDHRLRVLIPRAAEAARTNAIVGARLALLVTDITTYRSVMWKGRVESAGDPRSPGDSALIDRHVSSFSAASALVGIDPDVAWRFFDTDGIPLVIVVDEMFDQTPGPNAGRRLNGSPT